MRQSGRMHRLIASVSLAGVAALALSGCQGSVEAEPALGDPVILPSPTASPATGAPSPPGAPPGTPTLTPSFEPTQGASEVSPRSWPSAGQWDDDDDDDEDDDDDDDADD